jgi:hypothetical protein
LRRPSCSAQPRIRGAARVTGWKFAVDLVPLAYVGWSLWLLAIGVGLLATAQEARFIDAALKVARAGRGPCLEIGPAVCFSNGAPMQPE